MSEINIFFTYIIFKILWSTKYFYEYILFILDMVNVK